MRRRTLPWLALLAVLPLGAGCGGSPPPIPGRNVGDLAPEIEGVDVNGRPIKLSDYRGQVVVLDFWATWCEPCRRLIPGEKRILQRYAGKPLVFLGVSADNTAAELKQFLEEQDIPWPNIFDGRNGPIKTAWEVFQWPTIHVIDAKGVVRARDVGSERELEKTVEKLLAETGNP